MTNFNLIAQLSSWFFRRDREINTGGKDIDTGGGDVITGAGSVDGVDLTAHVANADAHHNRSHALDSGSDHSGTLPWADLNKAGSDLADLATRAHSALTGVTANQHHNESHTLASHTGTLSHDTDLTDVSANDHHNESHNVASHSDTSATGSELNTLTDGSDASTLHDHDGRYFQESEFSNNTGVNSKPLKTDSNGILQTYRLISSADTRVVSGLAVGVGNVSPPAKTIVLALGTAPGTPAAGIIYIYTKSSDGRLYYKNSTGTEYGPL